MKFWSTLAAQSVIVLAFGVFVAGCAEDHDRRFPIIEVPTPSTSTPGPTPTATPAAVGPTITFFGLTRADDRLIASAGENAAGSPVFVRPVTVPGASSGFSVVVEVARGSNGLPVGTSSYDVTLVAFPDLQIQVDRPLGNGSSVVCDDPMTMPGGVPAISPPNFADTEANIAVVNDLACRFIDGRGDTMARTSPQDSCVAFASGDFAFVDSGSHAQFCGFINVPLAFPLGDTIVTARVRDVDGNFGPAAQIVVRVE